ncbi:MAG TPA: hypothetical protein G4O10_01860 [Dehalococcoidia bacterium]|nr:hypothetical protein [Dehalococcoidia bacterium]
MKSKTLSLFLSCLVALTLVAWSCGGTKPVDGQQEEEEEEEEEEVIEKEPLIVVTLMLVATIVIPRQ